MGKLIMVLFFLVSLLFFQQDKYDSERNRMINDQIIARGIKDAATIEAMREVPRHLFVPDAQVPFAYKDCPLGIGHGQTISQPYIVAYMTEILHLKETHKVLEVGTGSGYQAAVLSHIVEEVYTIEIIRPLGIAAEERLKNEGFSNVKVKIADGYHGWKEAAPFDAIIVTAAAEHIPPPLIKQLKEGGRMIIPVGTPYYSQNLVLVQKTNGKAKSKSLLPVRFVPFTRSK
jgi:protein-L-isoaspartate(D-aspartate) O-methyltransferase